MIPEAAVEAATAALLKAWGYEAKTDSGTSADIRIALEAAALHMLDKYEWACQWKTFRDRDYDRMVSHHPLSRKPLTEAEAREEVESMLAARIPARLIWRAVSGWTAA